MANSSSSEINQGAQFAERYIQELFGQARAQFGQTYDLLIDMIVDATSKAHKDPNRPLPIDLDALDELIAGVAKSYLIRAGFSHATLPQRLASAIARRRARGLLTLTDSWLETAYKLGKGIPQDLASVGLKEAIGSPPVKASLLRVEQTAIKSLEKLAARYLQPILTEAGEEGVSLLLAEDRQATIEGTIAAMRGDVHPLFRGEPTPRRLRGFLGDRAGHWMRDWERVARTEMSYAHSLGQLRKLIEDAPVNQGKDPSKVQIPSDMIVYKIIHSYACVDCKALWLMPDKVTPRLFRLTEVLANGHNFGRKKADWKATIGPIHPNCLCGSVHRFIPGMTDKRYAAMHEQFGRFSELAGLMGGGTVATPAEGEAATVGERQMELREGEKK